MSISKNNFVTGINDLKREMEEIWGSANFGENSNRTHIVKFALLKTASGYSNGHTAMSILIELNLITKELLLTKKGKYWLWEFFQTGYKS